MASEFRAERQRLRLRDDRVSRVPSEWDVPSIRESWS